MSKLKYRFRDYNRVSTSFVKIKMANTFTMNLGNILLEYICIYGQL